MIHSPHASKTLRKQIGKTRAMPSAKAPWNHDENLQHLTGSLLKHSAGVQHLAEPRLAYFVQTAQPFDHHYDHHAEETQKQPASVPWMRETRWGPSASQGIAAELHYS